MTIGIMQPYIFPYIGYFQLMNAVDTFVFYDDVGFIKQGWINRNNLLLNKQKHPFTIPVQHISSFTPIKNTLIAEKPANWQTKLSATFRQAYQKAPHFDAVFPIVDDILRGCLNKSVGDVAIDSIKRVLQYIDLEKNLTSSYERYDNTHLRLGERVVDICRKENATTYINAIGGQSLYTKEYFSEHALQLYFLKPILRTYTQNTSTFIQGLSIVDVLMYNDPTTVKDMLSDYTLI